MTSCEDFKQLALLRLKEAHALYSAGLFEGAFYIGGYSIEFAFKVRICKILDLSDYLDDESYYSNSFKTHNFEELLILSGLKKKFDEACTLNQQLQKNWELVSIWNENARYLLNERMSKEFVKEFLNSIENPKDGIFPWIKERW